MHDACSFSLHALSHIMPLPLAVIVFGVGVAWAVGTAGAITGVSIASIAGEGTAAFADGSVDAAQFNQPYDVAALPSSTDIIYVTDRLNHRIREINTTSQTVKTIVGDGTAGFIDSVPALVAQLNRPECVRVLASPPGLIICDTNNRRIRRMDLATGFISTIIGDGGDVFDRATMDHQPGPAVAISRVRQITVDPQGNIFLVERTQNYVWKYTAATGLLHVVAGASLDARASEAQAVEALPLLRG
jgi:hypothetical protein